MYNKFIIPLLGEDIDRSVNKTGVAIRKIINPLMACSSPAHLYKNTHCIEGKDAERETCHFCINAWF